MSSRLRLYLFSFGCLALSSCASQSAMLVHPQSGSTVRCEEGGIGILAAAVGPRVEECLNRYQTKGYVPLEKLTPGQRADLERRGLLPKPE